MLDTWDTVGTKMNMGMKKWLRLHWYSRRARFVVRLTWPFWAGVLTYGALIVYGVIVNSCNG